MGAPQGLGMGAPQGSVSPVRMNDDGPISQMPQPQAGAASAQQPHLASGGLAMGGNSSGPVGLGGLIASPVAGRTDRLPMNVKPNSYVIPADVVSGLGQGNTMAGGRILDAMLKHGPHMKAATAAHGAHHFADGGESEAAPIIVAGGEYLVHPDVVAALGGGDHEGGHKQLDDMVLKVRKQTIKQLNNLPGPQK